MTHWEKWLSSDKIEKHQAWLKQDLKQDKDSQRLRLHSKDLTQADLSELDLRGCVFVDCDFSRANLTGVDLSQSQLQNCKFERAILRGANFQQAQINSCSFNYARASEADFSEAKLVSSSFKQAVLVAVEFSDIYALRTSFEQASLETAYFKRAVLNHCSFEKANFSMVIASGAHYKLCNLRAVNLTETVLADTYFSYCSFFACHGRPFIFELCKVIRPDFSEAGDFGQVVSIQYLQNLWRSQLIEGSFESYLKLQAYTLTQSDLEQIVQLVDVYYPCLDLEVYEPDQAYLVQQIFFKDTLILLLELSEGEKRENLFFYKELGASWQLLSGQALALNQLFASRWTSGEEGFLKFKKLYFNCVCEWTRDLVGVPYQKIDSFAELNWNLDLSPEQQALREQVKKLFDSPPKLARLNWVDHYQLKYKIKGNCLFVEYMTLDRKGCFRRFERSYTDKLALEPNGSELTLIS